MRDTQILKNRFYELYGAEPEVVSFAPGRVNLIGEHTDYNGGHVFPCALEMGISCAARRRDDEVLRFFSMDIEKAGVIETRLSALCPLSVHRWTAYPEGVIHAMIRAGYDIPCGADFVFCGDIPSGMGLSSSAALEVATGAAVSALFGLGISNTELALIGKSAENGYVGVNCGIMDQFASAMGKKDHAVFLDTATLEYSYAPLELGDAELVIVDSGVKHSLAGSAYNDRRRECEQALDALKSVTKLNALCDLSPDEFERYRDAIGDPVCRKRAKHAVCENARTREALAALDSGELEAFGRLMNESHISLRDDYEVSCPELDILTGLAWSVDGVIGARMTGGGFGGCMIAIVRGDAVDDFTGTVREGYLERTGLEARFITAKPGDGAHIIKD